MILEELSIIIEKNLAELGYISPVTIKKSNRPDLCDYQYDGLFNLSKEYHKNPFSIGEELCKKIQEKDDFNYFFKNIEVVKPGFLNITISDQFINLILKKMNSEDKFGIKQVEDTYVLDYGGPNIAKPLHVGHLRSAIVGESVKRIIEYKGCKTISDVHLGDFGLQIGQVIYGVKKYNKKIDEIDLNFLEKTYPEISLLCKQDEEVKEICATITKDLQDGNEEYIKIWKKICDVSGNDIKRLYHYLDINFDLWYGESNAYKYIPDVEKLVESKNLFQISDSAKIIDVKKDDDKKEIPPLIFKKSNGAYLYGTTDMATIYQRINDYHPSHILYFVDNRQGLHFEQVFRACEKCNMLNETKLEFLGFGTVNGMDGKPYKTRNGDAPKLDDLFNEVKEIFINKKETNKNMKPDDLDKIVNAILKFADLQNNREKDYVFDISKFSEVIGKTGPYILYTYLRINKIVKEQQFIEKFDIIYNDYDRILRKKIIEFDLAIEQAFQNRLPSIVAEYVYDLCVLVNTFYQNNHINGLKDENKKNEWLTLMSLSAKLLKEMFSLLIIDIPSVM